MRTVTLICAVFLASLTPALAAPIPPEILSQCEKQWGADYKKQLACIEEQLDAKAKILDLKAKGAEPGADSASRKIEVVETPDKGAEAKDAEIDDEPAGAEQAILTETPGEKAAEEQDEPQGVVTETPGEKAVEDQDEPKGVVVEAPLEELQDVDEEEEDVAPKKKKAKKLPVYKDVASYCAALREPDGRSVNVQDCIKGEEKYGAELEYAAAKYEGDIIGSALIVCRNFSFAFQKEAEGVYWARKPVFKCLTSKVATRVFSGCHARYTGQVFTPKVSWVAPEYAREVATCFNQLILTDGR